MSSANEIPGKRTDDIGVRSMPREFQRSDMNDRLHVVAEKITFCKEQAISLAVDSYRTVEARVKLTTAVLF